MPLTYRLRDSKIDFSFSPTGGPIDDTSPLVQELFNKLGRASAAWGRMEFLLDTILVHINKASESAELYDPRHAFGFKNKVELLKAWLDHPKLIASNELNKRVLSLTKELANSRNEILHSHLKHYDAATKEFTIQSIQYKGSDTFAVREGTLKLEALDVLADLANRSTLALTEIAGAIFQRAD
jgi:hypothetical protein